MGSEAPEERIVRYTAEELVEKRRRGETLSNWERVRNMTEEELEASIDFEEEGEIDWDVTYIGPGPEFTEAHLTFRCDIDVFGWFQEHFVNPEVRIAQVLTDHVEDQRDSGIGNLSFEWDEDKRRVNLAKHDIDFLRARSIFDGRPRVDIDSPVEDEWRLQSIAMLDATCVAAMWTERSGKIRLISVRHARRGERALFHRKTGIRPDGV
jgi:uncharacterized DUF497 family protein